MSATNKELGELIKLSEPAEIIFTGNEFDLAFIGEQHFSEIARKTNGHTFETHTEYPHFRNPNEKIRWGSYPYRTHLTWACEPEGKSLNLSGFLSLKDGSRTYNRWGGIEQSGIVIAKEYVAFVWPQLGRVSGIAIKTSDYYLRDLDILVFQGQENGFNPAFLQARNLAAARLADAN